MSVASNQWLSAACETVEKREVHASREDLEILGLGQVHVCGAVSAYISFVLKRNSPCSIGNFEFWSRERLSSNEESAETYGGRPNQLLIADWMLDSEFCAVDVASGMMVFLGGKQPITGTLSLAEFLRKVADDPTTPHGMM